MSSNVLRCCFADIFEEHLFSMRFRSLRIRFSLDLIDPLFRDTPLYFYSFYTFHPTLSLHIYSARGIFSHP